MNSTLRPCTSDELQVLAALAKRAPFGWRTWVTATGGASLLAAFVVSILSRHVTQLDVPGQWATLALLIALWIAISIPVFSRLQQRFGANSLRRDAAEALVQVEHLEVVDAIEMEEYEDLGSAYFIRTRDGNVRFLMGQYLYEIVENSVFPCTQLEIVRAPHSRILLDLKCSGDAIDPVRKIGPFRRELVRRGAIPNDGEVISAAWDDIERTYA